MRAVGYRVSLLAALCGLAGFAQTFEVASVKPAAPGQQGGIVRPMPGNREYMARNMPLQTIMTVAYMVTNRQISGGPAWTADDRWDLNAKADKPYATEQLRAMLQKLLEERFQLKLRRETREMPVWELVVDKGGPKMTKHDPNDIDRGPMRGGPNGRGLSGTNTPMSLLALTLSRLLDRNVIDKTGLDGYWDLTIDFVRDQDPNQDGPSIFTAVREQLGLRLAAAKGPVEHIVIESAERPSAN
jgi:uncharacterized protein (TIGR03435 family)